MNHWVEIWINKLVEIFKLELTSIVYFFLFFQTKFEWRITVESWQRPIVQFENKKKRKKYEGKRELDKFFVSQSVLFVCIARERGEKKKTREYAVCIPELQLVVSAVFLREWQVCEKTPREMWLIKCNAQASFYFTYEMTSFKMSLSHKLVFNCLVWHISKHFQTQFRWQSNSRVLFIAHNSKIS